MKFFTVHEPPDAPVDRIDRAETLTFIGDGFCKPALVFGPLWLLANQLWVALAGYVAIAALVAGLVWVFALPGQWIVLLIGALHVLLGFEAASLQRWALDRGGWQTLGTVSGRSIEECERRFLEGWLADQRARAGGMMTAAPGGAASGIGSQLAAMADGASGGRLGRGSLLAGWFGSGTRR